MPQAIQAVACTVDFSPSSHQVVATGAFLANRAGTPLYLVHAVNHPQDGVHADTAFERGGDLAHLKEDARQRLESLTAGVPVAWEPVIRFGDPVEQTVDVVKGLPACLVVAASHGVTGLRRLFTGTVIERLTRSLDQPMLVVKPMGESGVLTMDGFRTAIISCDRRGHWRRAATLMPLLQADSGSHVHLIHAIEGPPTDFPDEPEATSYSQSQQRHTDRLNREMSQTARRLFGHAQTLSATIAPGIPQEMVLQAARERRADVIMVGVRRSGKVGRWFAGSTTETLLRHAPCSVLTVPEPMESRGTGEGRR